MQRMKSIVRAGCAPLGMPSPWGRSSTVLASSSAVLVGRSACSNSGALASKFLLCVGAISGTPGTFLFTWLLGSISICWGLGSAFPYRRGQQVRLRSLATGLEKDMTLPERDARKIWGYYF
uniref:Uncharacterized protein n=1 Tax=Melopsittacus undulatus TaxID=13146 RepID=A0A8V5GFZ1_MELUD